MDIRQGKEVLVKCMVTGTIVGLNSGDKYRVKIGDTEIWIKPEDVENIKED